MTHGTLPLSSNKLDIANPVRGFGAIQATCGLVICLILAIKGPALYPRLVEFAQAFQPSPGRALNTGGIVTVLQSIVALFGIWVGVTNLVYGIRNFLYYYVPPIQIPKPIAENEKVLEVLFKDRAIETYRRPSGKLSIAASVFSKRLLYTTSTQRELVESLMNNLLVWPLVLAAAFFLHLPGTLFAALAAIGSVSICVRLVATLANMPPMPDVQVIETRDHLDNTGNPTNYFNHALGVVEQMRRGNFANRVASTSPQLGRTNRGETGEYGCVIRVETQPLPVERGIARSTLILDIGGAMLNCAAFAGFLFLTPRPGHGLGVEGNLALQALIAVIAAFTGQRLLKLGLELHRIFRFESDEFRIDMTGSYTASGIGLGDGRGSQLYSERVIMESDTHVRMYATRLITECHGLSSPRIVVDAQITPDFQERADHLRSALLTYEDSGKKLAGIDLASPELSSIVQANLEMNALQARAQSGSPGGAQNASEIGAVPPPVQLPRPLESDSKVCPDCGEQVKAVAHKCRFCGYRFDQQPASA
jgi:hypothetical protein